LVLNFANNPIHTKQNSVIQMNQGINDLDATDLKILEQLQLDASLSNVELARRVHLSPSPCLARVRALEARA